MKRFFLALALLASLAGFAPIVPAQQAKTPDRLAQDLAEKFSAELHSMATAYNGVMGIYIEDLTNGREFAVHADTVFPQASSIKIPLLIDLLRQAQAGRLNLDTRVEIHPAELVGGSGVLQFFSDGGSSISLHDLAVLMVVLSDNSATNLLIDRVSIESVNSMLDRLGLHETRLARKMMDAAAERADRENRSTPREMGTLVAMLRAGKLLDAAHTRMALDLLADYKSSPLRSGLPDSVTIADKPGSLDGAQCDTGIVLLGNRPYVISVMTTYNETNGDASITAVSRLAYRYFDRLAHANAYGVHVN